MYGGGGSVRMAGIARLMAGIGRPVQMIFLCGRNQALARQLEEMDLPYPHLIRTFTPRVPYYFGVSDFFVGKPGPGAISEALVSGIIPVVDAGQVLPQERYNLAWLKNRQRPCFQRVGGFGNPGQRSGHSLHQGPAFPGNRCQPGCI